MVRITGVSSRGRGLGGIEIRRGSDFESEKEPRPRGLSHWGVVVVGWGG